MEFRIVYYNAHRTGECEKTLVSALAPAGFSLNAAYAAANAQILGNFLAGGFVHNNLIIVVSGSYNGEDNITTVLSSAIDPHKPVKCEKLESPNAYFLTCEHQALLLLPDEPSTISSILKSNALAALDDFFKDFKNVSVTS